MEQILLALKSALPIMGYLDIKYSGPALQEIRKGRSDGLDVKRYIGKYSDWRVDGVSVKTGNLVFKVIILRR